MMSKRVAQIGKAASTTSAMDVYESASELNNEITDLQKKIALLDGDRKAYYENSQHMMQNNRETIQKLRAKNKNVRLILAQNIAGNEKVINDAFRVQDPARHNAMRGMSGPEAVAKLDQQVCETKKQLNNLDHQCKMREQKLQLLQTEYAQMIKDAKTVAESTSGLSDDAQQIRILENRLDKMHLKLNEAHKIRSTYHQIVEQQSMERRSWPSQLDALEQGIKEQDMELKRLHVMHEDAKNARATARTELAKLEQSVMESKKVREAQLKSYKQQAQEKKEHAENIEKRMMQRAITTREDRRSCLVLSGKEQEEKILTYEEHMQTIKEATGVSDIQEVVQRFLSQSATHDHLETWKHTNEKSLQRLKEEEELLQNEFEQLKYSGEAKMSSGERMLEDLQEHLKVCKTKREEAKSHEEAVDGTLVDIRIGVEHLTSKMHNLKLPKNLTYMQGQLNPASEKYEMDCLNICEKKLIKLMEDLSGKDICDVMKELEDVDYRLSVESKMPSVNTRVRVPHLNKETTAFEDEDESGDEDDYFSRNSIKNNSQQIVDAKTRKDAKKAGGAKPKGKK